MAHAQFSMRHCIMNGYNDIFQEKANMFSEHLRDGDLINDSYLHDAARYNNTFAIQILLDKGSIDPSRQNIGGNTPLHVAAYQGNCESIKLLVANGADPNVTNEKDETPLHRAVTKGRLEAVKLLLSDSQVDAASQEGVTALHIAARTGQLEILKLLVAGGASLTACSTKNRGALHFGAISGDLPTISYLLSCDLPVMAVDSHNRTARRAAYKPAAVEFLTRCEEVSHDAELLKALYEPHL